MTLLYETAQIQGASKNKAETYLVYVEHLFLCSNAVDASSISKGVKRQGFSMKEKYSKVMLWWKGYYLNK